MLVQMKKTTNFISSLGIGLILRQHAGESERSWMKKSSDIIAVCFQTGWRSSGRHILSMVWTASASNASRVLVEFLWAISNGRVYVWSNASQRVLAVFLFDPMSYAILFGWCQRGILAWCRISGSKASKMEQAEEDILGVVGRKTLSTGTWYRIIQIHSHCVSKRYDGVQDVWSQTSLSTGWYCFKVTLSLTFVGKVPSSLRIFSIRTQCFKIDLHTWGWGLCGSRWYWGISTTRGVECWIQLPFCAHGFPAWDTGCWLEVALSIWSRAPSWTPHGRRSKLIGFRMDVVSLR